MAESDPVMVRDMPRIPGVELLEEIGTGGCSTVYLGRRSGSQEEVAVRLLRDSESVLACIENYRASTEIHRRLAHRNIATLLDAGTWEEGWYQVLEYLPGGDLHTRIAGGMHIQTLLKVIKDIARALDHMHQAGFLHGDVKPENVLFRANGSAVLCDFDTVRPIGHSAGNAQGKVIGTPEYMSPEQSAGRALDGRSDIYSLGVMLFRLLSGDLPYRADTAVALGIKHLQDPIPRLPAYLSLFQPMIDKALAKRPEQRFSRALELVEAIDEVRLLPAVPPLTIKTRAITTKEILAVGGDLLSTPLDPARQERRSARARRRRQLRAFVLLLLLGGSLGGGGYYAYQQGLLPVESVLSRFGIGEDPLVAEAWSEAQSLRQDPNQGLAAIVAAYRRVLALMPEHEKARAEVAGLAADWRESINQALQQGNLELAETRLREADAVFPNDLEWVQLNVQLQNRQRAERIMVSTQALLTSHGLSDLPSATAAIQSYQEVLRLAPGHEQAQQALNELAVHYVGMAKQAAISGEVNQAISLLERATLADGQLPQLDEVRTLISRATTAQAAISDLLQQARSYRAEDQLISPTGENAAELYHRVLATDPDNVVAAQGLDEVTAQVTANADALLAQGDLEAVESLVNQAAAVALSADVLNDLRRQIDREIGRRETIASNLQEAEALMQVGYLTAPAQRNAVAFLREVQQLDPGNEEARQLLRSCAERLAGVAVEAHEYGLIEQANQYLDLALTIAPGVEEWLEIRKDWETQ